MVLIGARAHDFSGKTPDALFSAISEAGYKAMQLACPKSFGWAYPLTEERTEAILRGLDKTGLSVRVLGCYVECAAADKETRLNAVETFCRGIKTGHDLGVTCVGTETCHFEGTPEEHKKAFDDLTDSALRMAEAAEKYNVDIGFEPVWRNTLCSPELALELKNRVGSRHVRFIWDAINLLDPLSGRDERAYQEYTAKLLGDDILAMHIKDVRWKGLGEKKSVPLTEGEYDWSWPFSWAARQKDMALLREEAIPARAAEEIAAMKKLLNGESAS